MKPGDQVRFKPEVKWDPKKYLGEVDPDGIYTILEIHEHLLGPYVTLEGEYPNYPLASFKLAGSALEIDPGVVENFMECKLVTFKDKHLKLHKNLIPKEENRLGMYEAFEMMHRIDGITNRRNNV